MYTCNGLSFMSSMLVFDEAKFLFLFLWKGAARGGYIFNSDNLNMFHKPTQMMSMLIFKPWGNVEGNSHAYQSVSNV